jgi:hypothetical protein
MLHGCRRLWRLPQSPLLTASSAASAFPSTVSSSVCVRWRRTRPSRPSRPTQTPHLPHPRSPRPAAATPCIRISLSAPRLFYHPRPPRLVLPSLSIPVPHTLFLHAGLPAPCAVHSLDSWTAPCFKSASNYRLCEKSEVKSSVSERRVRQPRKTSGRLYQM